MPLDVFGNCERSVNLLAIVSCDDAEATDMWLRRRMRPVLGRITPHSSMFSNAELLIEYMIFDTHDTFLGRRPNRINVNRMIPKRTVKIIAIIHI